MPKRGALACGSGTMVSEVSVDRSILCGPILSHDQVALCNAVELNTRLVLEELKDENGILLAADDIQPNTSWASVLAKLTSVTAEKSGTGGMEVLFAVPKGVTKPLKRTARQTRPAVDRMEGPPTV